MELGQAKLIIDRAIQNKHTLIMVGDCEVNYLGRAGSRLDHGERIVIVKADGCFLVHQPTKMPPVNYQTTGTALSCELCDGILVLKGTKRKPKEVLEVKFKDVSLAECFDLRDSRRITVRGMERDLAELLRQDLNVIEPGLRIANHESCLQRGMVDIWARDPLNRIVLVEIKRRRAGLDAVSQLHRYVQEVRRMKGEEVRGILCAPEITPNARAFLEKEGLEFQRLDFAVGETPEIKGLQKKQHGLNEFI